MTWTLFIIGALTSLGCGLNIVTVNRASWQHEAVWMIGGVIGAVIMFAAVWLGRAA